MSEKNIELELRAEINKKEYPALLRRLKKDAKFISYTKRLSFMSFGKIKNKSFDIRVRITNGEAELVIKKGALYAHDRIEKFCAINKSQFMPMVELFILLDFNSEIAERETYNFKFRDNILFSLVLSKSIAYVEIEKISKQEDLKQNHDKLLNVLNKYNIKPITKKRVFDDLCNRLSKTCDWKFRGSTGDFAKLRKILAKY